jgi:hypothetical protein
MGSEPATSARLASGAVSSLNGGRLSLVLLWLAEPQQKMSIQHGLAQAHCTPEGNGA